MKKNENILRMMSGLDEKYIEEAEKMNFRPQKAVWKRVSAIAASVALVAAICAFPIWGNFGSHEIDPAIETHDLSEKEIVWDAQAGVFILKYRADDSGAETEIAVESATETVTGNAVAGVGIGTTGAETSPLTPNVLYPYMTGEYAAYNITKGRVTADKIGEKLGDVTMKGADGETLSAEAYTIVGIDARCAVAVQYPDYAYYCIFRNANVEFSSFAEFKAAYSLNTELYMGIVMVEHTVADNSDKLVEFSSIAPLKAMILALDGESCTYQEFAKNCDMKMSIGVEVSQSTFWKYASGLQIFEDGYLVTNVSGGLLIFDIGEDAARKIIADAKAHQYRGVNFYEEARDVFVDQTKGDDYTGALPETEISGPYIPSSGDDPYELVTPSYDPHKPGSEQTEIAWETEIYVVPEIHSTESDLHETNPLIYEGKDPYAWTETTTAAPPYMPKTEESGAYATNPLVYDPYGYLDGTPD